MSEVSIKTEAVEQKVYQVRAFCPDCEDGYLVATGRVGSQIQGAPPQFEHICLKCEKTFGLDQAFPTQFSKDADLPSDEESEFQKQVTAMQKKQQSTRDSGLILPS